MRSTERGLVGPWLEKGGAHQPQTPCFCRQHPQGKPRALGGGVTNPGSPAANAYPVENLEVREAGCAQGCGLLTLWGQASPCGAPWAWLGGMVR